jgi:integrase
MLLMFQCGLRRSEALAVRKEDIEGGVILIRGRVIQQRVEGTKRSSVIYQPMTKTKRPRQVPIIDPWLLEVAANSPPGFLIHERDPSLPLTPNKVTSALTGLAHGTPFEGVSPQDLRRSAATAFAVSNVPLAIAETIMGHQSKILKEVYARVSSQHQANAMRTAFRTGDLSVTYPKCQTMPEKGDSTGREPEIGFN